MAMGRVEIRSVYSQGCRLRVTNGGNNLLIRL